MQNILLTVTQIVPATDLREEYLDVTPQQDDRDTYQMIVREIS